MLVLALIYFGYLIFVNPFEPFQLSISCMHNSSYCNKEELEYLSIAELHDQIDDDKNGNIDIAESKDYVEELAFSRGTEKAKKIHKNDAQIDKQDLWHIWRTSEVSNWTTNNLITWLSDEVELPQYIDKFMNLKLNGSLLPRLTGNDYLMNIVKISNSIHRKKIMIKAVDAVLFGPTKKYQLTTKWVIVWLTLFAIITLGFLIQTLYSKRYVKNLQKKLESLGKNENTLLDLREKIKEAEEFKLQKHYEIQEMEERHRFELSSTKNSSRDSLFADTDKLHEAYKEIVKLKVTLVEYQLQIHKLTKSTMCHSFDSNEHKDGHLLQSLLQLTHATERQYLSEKISAIDRQSMEFKELNEKVKKKKSGFMGAFRLVHTNDLDELEKGFAATKKAYETLIYEKNEQESRWNKLESITGLNLIHCGDLSTIKQELRWIINTPFIHEGTSSSNSIHRTNDESFDSMNQSQNKTSGENVVVISDSIIQSNQSIPDIVSIDSVDSSINHLSGNQTLDNNETNSRSRKDFSQTRRHVYGAGKTRIASLNRTVKKKDK